MGKRQSSKHLGPRECDDRSVPTYRVRVNACSKVASNEGLPRKDRNAIGKAIVGRPGKDDHWVTTGTAACTFTAATREFPEDFRKPVNVHRLRQVCSVTLRLERFES